MAGTPCPNCTFLNHPSMRRCEMCDTPLPVGAGGRRPQEVVKTDFGQGEQDTFLESLHESLQDQDALVISKMNKINLSSRNDITSATSNNGSGSPNVSTVGISGILRNIDETQTRQSETMVTAFTDLQALMAQAADMVQLAEALNAKVQAQRASDSTPDPSSEDITAIQMSLVNLGLETPAVTRDLAGAKYHAELAQELADFLTRIDIFRRQANEIGSVDLQHNNASTMQPNCISLTDIYCMYNRARGVALISPHDLHKACEIFPALNLPYRLRNFSSGLVAIEYIRQDVDENLLKIVDLIKERRSATAAELSRLLGQHSLGLVRERLQLAEAKGLICRDKNVQGDKFHENLFADYKWDGSVYIEAL